MTQAVTAQDTVKALFLGNSYTHRNSMPAVIDAFAKSTGDRMIYKDHTPGGFTLSEHLNEKTSTDLIQSDKWDFVVLQEQSQLPSFPDSDVQQLVYPAATGLVSLIKASDSCTEAVFYRTWGRKNGDARNCAFWPPVCTYEGMDSLLALRYQTMADANEALVSPVGEVWKKIRAYYPSLELYRADESHPSEEGSYAAACCFYTLFFRKDPTLSSYKYSLNDSNANRIKRLTKRVVFNHFERWNIGEKDPKVDFEVLSNTDGLVSFKATASNAVQLKWDFGDGQKGTASDTAYQYDSSATYTVQLVGAGCRTSDTVVKQITVKINNVGMPSLNDVADGIRVFDGLVSFQFEGDFSLRFMDLNGRMLYTGNHKNEASIPTAQLPNLYIVEVRSGKQLQRLLQINP